MKIGPSATTQEVSVQASLITRIFRTGLARPPELAALQHFTVLLREGGGVNRLAHAIAESEEFLALHGREEICDEAYVTRLFRNGLDRVPDAHTFTTLVNTGSRADILAIVANSEESRSQVNLLQILYPDGPPPADELAYTLWLDQYERLSEESSQAITLQVAEMPGDLRISLLMIAGRVRPDLVLETLKSLDNQFYPYWNLYIACAHDLPAAILAMLRAAATRMPAVELVEALADASVDDLWQTALARADGQFVAFLETGDQLAPTALYEMASVLHNAPHLDLVYSDEDSINGTGHRFDPLFKPGWSPDMLLSGDMIGQLALIRRTRIINVGGIRMDGNPQARYDLLLRLTNDLSAEAIHHVPSILYHRGRRPGRPLPFPRSRNTSVHPDVMLTVARHLKETGSRITVSDTYIGGGVWPRVTFPLPTPSPRVSVLIPTHNQPDLLRTCVSGLLQRTAYPDIEVLIADNGSTSIAVQHLLHRLSHDPRVRVEAIDVPLNWSLLNNRLAALATGDIFVLMNDDIEVIGSDWLDEMVRHLGRPGVGVVGARLLYRDATLQHGGIVLDSMGATHVLRSARKEEPGYMGQLVLTRDLSAVTGACLAIRRDVFHTVGGVDETFAYTSNDIDLCLRARAAGYRVVWTPHALLTHLDGASRGRDESFAQLSRFWRDLRRLHDRWSDAMDFDPFLNANLLATDHHLVLATPPRHKKPWQTSDGSSISSTSNPLEQPGVDSTA